MKKSIALFVVSIENSKILKYHTYFEKKNSPFYYFQWVWQWRWKKYLKKKNQLTYYKFVV